MAEYLHGAYALYQESGLTVPTSSGTLPVYFGVAPVHQLADYSGAVATPILLRNNADAVAAVGYTDAWAQFSLGEALYVHFKSANPVGPIVVVNVLDPAVHRKAEQTTLDVLFANGRATVPTTTAIANTVEFAAESTGELTATYDTTGTVLQLVADSDTVSGTQSVAFYEVDPTAITAASIVTLIEDTIAQVHAKTGLVPSILAAPGWSDHKTVNDALKSAAREINGHWNAYVFSDMSVDTAKTIVNAISLKTTQSRNSEIESPCWPMATDGDRVYHISTLSVAASQLVDQGNDDIPFETSSNKPVAVSGMVVSDGEGGYTPVYFDKLEANRLNAKGIRTVTFWGGRWKLWGPHTGHYDFDANNTPEYIFDAGVRMAQFLGNNFQLKYGDEVDKPMHRSRIDTILNAEQEVLDNYSNRGALLFGEIAFVPESNPESDLMAGQFVYDTSFTTTPPARAIINRYRYTATGLQLLIGGGANA